jgi:hypothetical protein
MLCLLKVEDTGLSDGLVDQTNTAGENKQVNNEMCAKCKTKHFEISDNEFAINWKYHF